MVFREAPARTWPKGHVVHGPFPARLRLFAFSFAFAFVGALFTWMALMTEHIACPASGLCMRNDQVMFDHTQLRDVHMEQRTGSKNAKYGVVVLGVERGGHVE